MMYGEWISTAERKPDKQTPVLVCVPPHIDNDGEQYSGYVGMAYYTSFGDGFWAGTDGNLYGAIGGIPEPTHWMPLPDMPTADHPCASQASHPKPCG